MTAHASKLTSARRVEPERKGVQDSAKPERSARMPKYNRNFDLTLNDIDLIEAALSVVKRDLSLGRKGAQALLPDPETGDHLRDIDDLMGRLHNQKIFYRPEDEPYVSG
jgi:ribosomal protein L1